MITVETGYPQIAVGVNGHTVRVAFDFFRFQVKNHFAVGCKTATHDYNILWGWKEYSHTHKVS